MPSSRPNLRPAERPAPVGHTVRVTAPPQWRPWLIAQLVDAGFARQSENRPDKIYYYLTKLEAAIAAALPDGAVSLDTLGNTVYRGMVPSHHTARGLAAALGVSEIAILLRSGQLDFDAVTPLLGDMPAILRTESEYRAALAHAGADPDPAFRSRMVALVQREWQASQRLEARLRWLGITAEEWERMRLDLNSPDGRRRLVRALYGGDVDVATPDDNVSVDVPDEFTAAARDAKAALQPVRQHSMKPPGTMIPGGSLMYTSTLRLDRDAYQV